MQVCDIVGFKFFRYYMCTQTSTDKKTKYNQTIFPLNGEWNFCSSPNNSSHDIYGQSMVPGCIHTDLLNNGLIQAPFYRDNEAKQFWISHRTWEYSKQFNIPSEFLSYTKKELVFNSLDTLATIYLNEKLLGQTNNQFREWKFDITQYIKEKNNLITIYFHPATEYCSKQQKSENMYSWGTEGSDITEAYKFKGSGHLRKSPANFGWDWGPQFITCGIKGDVSIVGRDFGQIKDFYITQNHKLDNIVTVNCSIDLDVWSEVESYLEVIIKDNNTKVSSEKVLSKSGENTFSLDVPNPKYWWPNNMGDPYLYQIEINFMIEGQGLIESINKNIGLRTIELIQEKDEYGESFYFKVNGISIFAKGANWIPADVFQNEVHEKDYLELLTSARDANMNMIRVWGGGIYEPNCFYDICDSLGLLVWQDFMFACSMYPVNDIDFLKNVKAEATDIVKRLRNHACLALWCGNNELECGFTSNESKPNHMTWEEYDILFTDLLSDVVKENDPSSDYCRSSGFSPLNRDDPNDPHSGDAHLWKVWHQKKPFEEYRNDTHRFVSEFGFQSFPSVKTLKEVFKEEDLSINSYMMEYHQRSPIGNGTIIQYMLDWMILPQGFDNLVIATQILQSIAIKYAIEHWRRIPQTMGGLYWQLNDCWQAPSWSSIDYNKRWKALHYEAKRFFNPYLISGIEHIDTGTVEIHLTSDHLTSVDAKVECSVFDCSGKLLLKDIHKLKTPVNESVLVKTLDLQHVLVKEGSRNCLVFMELISDDVVLSSNLVIFKKPKHIPLQKPSYEIYLEDIHNGNWELSIKTNKPSLWVWIETPDHEIKWDNQFFHMQPSKTYKLRTHKPSGISLEELRENIQIKNLTDLHR